MARFGLLIALVWMLVGWGDGVGVGNSAAQTICDETAGTTQRHEYVADVIQTRMYYTVYTPPCYDPNRTERYPVLYLMHGSNDDDNHWLRLGLQDVIDTGIREGEFEPFIVVMPFGNWIANENRFNDASWYGVFVNQLMPLVESQYHIDGTRSHRAIGGISRGGFWAYHIALRNPVMFSAVGGHSAFFDRYHATEEYNPLDLALSAPGVQALRLWLDRGADDYAAPGLDIMDERLSERGVDYQYTIYPQGQHNNDYWRVHVADYIAFYTQNWTVEPSVQATATTPPIEQTAEPTPENTASGLAVYLPVVAFNSLNANIAGDLLDTLWGGLIIPELVLSESTAAALTAFGVPVAPGTRIVADDTLYNTLYRDTSLFTLIPFDELIPRYRVLNVDERHPLDQLDEYAYVFESDTPNFQADQLTRMLMSGVTALTRDMIPVLDANGVEWAASGILPYVNQADFFHTSNEVSIVEGCPQPSVTGMAGAVYSFCSKLEHFALFHQLGLDIVELSGNHNNDYGYDAYRNTLQWYRDNEIAIVGGGETLDAARTPLLIDHNGNSVALLSCNWVGPYYALVNEDENLLGGVRPGAADCDRNWLAETIPALKDDHDLVIITVQYLELEQYTPSAQQRLDFRYLADLGADVVLGTQAHFPQGMEFYAAAPGHEAFIHYGLGNLFFDQQFFAGVRFFMDQLFIYDGRLVSVDLFTGLIEEQGRPRPMTPDERQNFLYLILIQNG